MHSIRVGCAVVAEKNGRLLLGRRGKEPYYGKWIIPGGGVKLFETLTETALREFDEETGLQINVQGIAHVAQIVAPPNEHRIVIYVHAEVVGGVARAGSDLLEIGFFERSMIEQLALHDALTPTVEGVLCELGWLRRDNIALIAQPRMMLRPKLVQFRPALEWPRVSDSKAPRRKPAFSRRRPRGTPRKTLRDPAQLGFPEIWECRGS
jgi:8-oxo-dGTP diphosphatase